MLNDSVLKHRDKVALIFPQTNQSLTHGELDDAVDRVASWLLGLGLQAGDGIALLMENRPEFIVIGRAAIKAGLYYTPISTHLASDELAHILQDSAAMILIASSQTLEKARQLHQQYLSQASSVIPCFTVDEACDDFLSVTEACNEVTPLLAFPERPQGRDMLYSSGTTGKPKGVRRSLTPFADRDKPEPGFSNWQATFQIDRDAVYLSPAPLYHAAPLRYCMRVLNMGATCVILKKFDAQEALRSIEQYRVTHSQWVPTMFVRLLELPPEIRNQYDLSSMTVAVHAAAPCPVHTKQAMFAWWGDIIHEYYAGSEVVGTTWITPQEWHAHPGSVGRAMMGHIHIVGEDGQELPAGEIGKIYFSGAPGFAYLNDPEKTKSAYNEHGWATYGDIGHIDEQGFLYLSDRRADLILSGGVNIYPFEIESVLSRHAEVQDVAVVGVPDAVFGEVPKAIVQLRAGAKSDEQTAQRLIDFAQVSLAKIKLPRTVVFVDELPRLETGKLLRRVLKERYREQVGAGFLVRSAGKQ